MSRCLDCAQARQVGDKSRQDTVGCSMFTLADTLTYDFIYSRKKYTGRLYEGYMYAGRRPFDIEESAVLGKGVLAFGIITDADARCIDFEENGQ